MGLVSTAAAQAGRANVVKRIPAIQLRMSTNPIFNSRSPLQFTRCLPVGSTVGSQFGQDVPVLVTRVVIERILSKGNLD
jgi:hypothetical protein